ncbi:hypothetical protein ABT160_35800 [Streptomyces sp. NPDC001941]|uniref:vWA domain-containing protein n=1 Tax=Streptomyces sp. NPDC001941 TaxID=3154659 RepID=UPI003326CA94
MTDPVDRLPVLPVYVAADESTSMRPFARDLNAGVDALHRALLSEPMAAARVRICLLGFADGPVVRLPLTDLRDVESMPELKPTGMTRYGTLFRFLAEQIPDDVATLRESGLRVMRPVVFFLTDGLPTDDWPAAHHELTSRHLSRTAPHIVACGLGAADAPVVAAVATEPGFGFVPGEALDVPRAVDRFFSALTLSVVKSARVLPGLVVEVPEGFQIAIDEI